MGILQPGLHEFFPWDPDYSGFYRLNNFQELGSTEFRSHIHGAMCLQSKRQQCKLRAKGTVIMPTQNPATYEGDAYQYTEDEYDYAEDYDGPAYTGNEYESERAIYEGGAGAAAGPATPDPQCCGGSLYNAKTFDNNAKQCSFNYDNEMWGVSPRE